jgi:hypothetical protein
MKDLPINHTTISDDAGIVKQLGYTLSGGIVLSSR